MVVFILEDQLKSGRFFFGGNENTVAIANGQKLDHQVLDNKIQEMEGLEKAAKQTDALDNETTNHTVQTVYQQMVTNMLLDPECKKLGIAVSDSELTDLLLGSHPSPELIRFFSDPKTGQLFKDFVDPKTGGINMTTVLEFVKQLNNQNPTERQYFASWTMLEQQIKEDQFQSKYFDLLRNGLYVTGAEAKQDFEDQNTYYNITYLLKKYTDLPASSVQVSDDDVKSYYNQHLYEYSQPQETRTIDYVTYYAAPTQKDLAQLNNLVDSLASRFKKLKPGQDSSFIVNSSDEHDNIDHDHLYDPNYYKPGQMDPTIDTIMSNSEKGFVYGPYKENNEYRIAKVLDIQDLPDSSKLSIIAIPADNGDFTKAKALADSIKGQLTADNFATFAQKYSKDGSAQKGGDIGWVHLGKISPELEHAAFFSNKGDITEVQSQGAEILILTADQSQKEKHIQYGMIVKKIQASPQTIEDVYSQANAFSGKYPTTEAFEKAANQMNKRVVELKENDATIAGLQSPKEVIRWAFSAKTGDVSQAFDVGGDRYVVAHLVQITPMGTIPLALIKDKVTQQALQEKKAEKLIADMNSTMTGVTDINALGQKAGVTPVKLQRLLFNTYSIPGLGPEGAVLGVMSAIKPNTLSKPIKGELGVYVIEVDSVYTPVKPDYAAVQEEEQATLRNRVQYDAFAALEKKAGLVSHLGKFY